MPGPRRLTYGAAQYHVTRDVHGGERNESKQGTSVSPAGHRWEGSRCPWRGSRRPCPPPSRRSRPLLLLRCRGGAGAFDCVRGRLDLSTPPGSESSHTRRRLWCVGLLLRALTSWAWIIERLGLSSPVSTCPGVVDLVDTRIAMGEILPTGQIHGCVWPPNLAFCLDVSSLVCLVVWPASGVRLYLAFCTVLARSN